MTGTRIARAELRQDVATLLDGLGQEPDSIAASLASSGVQGHPRLSTDCAIARYLNAVIGADPRVGSISVGRTVLRVRGAHWWSSAARVVLPRPVRLFIASFDSGRYPELVCRSVSPTGRSAEWSTAGFRSGAESAPDTGSEV